MEPAEAHDIMFMNNLNSPSNNCESIYCISVLNSPWHQINPRDDENSHVLLTGHI